MPGSGTAIGADHEPAPDLPKTWPARAAPSRDERAELTACPRDRRASPAGRHDRAAALAGGLGRVARPPADLRAEERLRSLAARFEATR